MYNNVVVLKPYSQNTYKIIGDPIELFFMLFIVVIVLQIKKF